MSFCVIGWCFHHPVISCVLCSLSICCSSVTPEFSSVLFCGIAGSLSSCILLSFTEISSSVSVESLSLTRSVI